jgi:hypothetical protein
VNAVLLGALAATRILPMKPDDFEAAIREGGVAVERNLAGFKSGMEIVEGGLDGPHAMTAPPPWSELRSERAATLGRRGAAFRALADRIEAEFPDALHRTLGEAVARLIDYQDSRYAELFLERVRRIRDLDPGTRLSEISAAGPTGAPRSPSMCGPPPCSASSGCGDSGGFASSARGRSATSASRH